MGEEVLGRCATLSSKRNTVHGSRDKRLLFLGEDALHCEEEECDLQEFDVVRLPEAVMSNDLDELLDIFSDDLRTLPSSSLVKAWIIVPNGSIRAWFAHELAKKEISLLRFEILLLDEALRYRSSRLTRHHVIPLLMAFLDNLQKTSPSPLPHSDTAPMQYLLARKLRLPWTLRAFLGEAAACAKDAERERLWQQFVRWCPLPIPSMRAPTPPCPTVPLFLFGFSSLNPVILHQLLAFPTLQRLYCLSPCMLFWGDQSSDHELRHLLTDAGRRHLSRPVAEHLERLLYDRHRLLANSGQVGREFMILLEESSLQTCAAYRLPAALAHPPYTDYLLPEAVIHGGAAATLLDHVKADILLLIGRRDTPHDLPADSSIEVHGAPTPLREVEALRRRLADFSALPPASILILVTDMSRYAAAVAQVFGEEIPYQMWEQEEHNGILTAFRMMIHLLMSKGTLNDWLQLLRHPIIQVSLSISSEEADAIIAWLSTSDIHWGLSQHHRQRYLASRAITPTATATTFDEEWSSLLTDLLTATQETTVDVSLLKPLGAFFHFLHDIETWWSLPLQESHYAPMASFATLFATLLDSLLKGSTGGFEGDALTNAIATFSAIASQTASPQIPAAEALSTIYTLITNNLSRTRLHLSAPVIVAPLATFQPFPAQLIAILGAHDGALPEHSQDQLLDRLDRMVPNIPASSALLDRYAFIEILLAAKNLFITYQSYAFDIRESVPYSPIVADLLAHLDANYTIAASPPSSRIHTIHPLSRPHYPSQPRPRPPTALVLDKKSPSPSLAMTTLQYTAHAPLDVYYKEQYALAAHSSPSPSLFMPPWEIRSRLERDIATAAPSTPHPSYQKAFSVVHASLRTMNITPTTIDLHLLPTIATPCHTPAALLAPVIDTSPSIVGTWPSLIKEGILITSDEWRQELFSRWPEHAIRTYIAHTYHIPIAPCAILLKNRATLSLPPSNTIHVWAEFAALATTTPFPFSYDIVKVLLTHPSPHDVYRAIIAHAETRKGAWRAFADTLTIDICTHHLPQWEQYASLLWSDLFTLPEAT